MKKQISDNDNSQSSGIVILIVKIIFAAVFIACLGVLMYYNKVDELEPLESAETPHIEEWTVTDPNGKVITAGSSFRNEEAVAGTFTIVSRLPDEISDDLYLCFIVGGDVAVYIDGELRKDFIAERDMYVPGGCVKRFYMRVPLLSSDAGTEVKILRAGTSSGGYVYQDTFIADGGDFFSYMMERYGITLMLEQILLMGAAVVVLASLVMMLLYRRRIEMLYGAMSILVIAAWLITNSYLYPFMYGHYHIDGLLNYMFCLMMPFNLTFYLDALQHGRYRKLMRIILCVAALNLLVWPVLHFTRTFSFPKALIYIDAFLAVELLIVAGILVFDLIKGGMHDYKYTAIGIAGFMVCGFGEILILNFIPFLNGDILMLMGLTFLLTLSVVQQLSDLRKVREEGLRAVGLSEAKTRFLASMSHEIRTPINAILGMNEMILRENNDPVIDEYAASVKSSGQMLLMLVNDVLDFSKIEAGKMEITYADFTFSSLLHNIMPMLKERADEKNLKLDVVIEGDVPDCQISDEFRIRQILINLMNNAIKYTDSGSVTLTIRGEYTLSDAFDLEISVKDTGRGISEEDQKTLFEAFSRADVKKNRNIEGTGLGLAIVKSIVDSMGGNIRVESVYGEGSDFIVNLPVATWDDELLTGNYDDRAASRTPSGTGCDYTAPDASILAVDDNNANLKIVKLFLKRAGIVPELCDSGTKAIELCKQKQYDLILLDHMMPDPDGIKTLEIIQSDEASLNKDTPTVVLTANALAGSAKIYLEAGFADYLTKPIDSSLLEKTIKRFLPPEKVHPVTEEAEEEVLTFEPVSVCEKLKKIEGLDFAVAMNYTGGDEELLEEIVKTIAEECDEKVDQLRGYVKDEDWNAYGITAHSIKGLMLSIGLKELSERAQKHEYAAKDRDIEFIRSDCEGFFEAYQDICRKL